MFFGARFNKKGNLVRVSCNCVLKKPHKDRLRRESKISLGSTLHPFCCPLRQNISDLRAASAFEPHHSPAISIRLQGAPRPLASLFSTELMKPSIGAYESPNTNYTPPLLENARCRVPTSSFTAARSVLLCLSWPPPSTGEEMKCSSQGCQLHANLDDGLTHYIIDLRQEVVVNCYLIIFSVY
jgi:hypothetical protein